MKSQTTCFVVCFCLFISVTTGSALIVAQTQTSLAPAPSDAEIFRARVFQEPLVPVGDKTTPAENAALNYAIESYTNRADGDDLSAITGFIERHPKSPWRAALLVNLGLTYRQSGWFLKALAAWEQAWKLSEEATEAKAKALADRAIGELVELNTRIGRLDQLEALLKQIEHRPLIGSATEKVAGAQEGSWWMRKEPGKAFTCGVAALSSIFAFENPAEPRAARLSEVQSTSRGLSLRQLDQLASELKMDYVVAKRAPGAKVIVPSVVNWKAEHYAALVREENGHFLTKDPILGGEIWVTRAALDAESSGYFLIPRSKVPSGWQLASAKEASRVWGRGFTQNHDENGTKVNDPKAKDPECPKGMAIYNFHLQTVSLNITDTPVGHVPPAGPSMVFTATYNQREFNQPANFDYSNLGPKWNFNWLSYITDDSGTPSASVTLHTAGGGAEIYLFDNVTGGFKPEFQSGATLERISSDPIVYERISSGGSRERFAESDKRKGNRRVFLSQRIDPVGNFAELVYDSLRLVQIYDAVGNPPTTLSYDDPVDTYKITRVTDPFGRFATFAYKDGNLTSITDTIGIVSQFIYEDANHPDFVTTLTTPYRSTSFVAFTGADPYHDGGLRRIEATDTLTGERERVEYRQDAPGIPGCPEVNCDSDPNAPGIVPPPLNHFHNFRNTFYWDKRAMALYPPGGEDPDYSKARLTQWVHTPDTFGVSNIKEREKEPLENPVYYFYPREGGPPWSPGSTGLPSIIAQKLLPDGTDRITGFERNARGRVTKSTDPVGRVTYFDYAANQIDLVGVYQKNPKGKNQYPDNEPADKLFDAIYNDSHQPLTVWNTAGQVTSYTYTTGTKQIETITDANEKTTTYGYGDGSTGHPVGYLTSITSPEVNGAAASTEFYYDSARRVEKVTSNPDGYFSIIEYDALDRPTRITYPDNTTEEFQYMDSVRGMTLDLTASKDRLDRWTYRHYNADRNMDSIVDFLTQTTYDWCSCGSLNSITDPNGNMTIFNRDLQGRVYEKVFQDNTKINYLYEGQNASGTPGATSRLKSATDALNRRTNYSYFLDNNIQQVSYTDTSGNPLSPPTPSVSYNYDPYFNRMTTMEDGTGTTDYTYYYIGTPGYGNDGKLANTAGPLDEDTITFIYDKLGRVTSQTIEGGDESTVQFDALGRLTTSHNALGEFGRTYYGATSRLDTLTYPSGQTTHYIYFGNSKDRRLQTLQNRNPQTVNLSKFDYDYDSEGEILSWARQLGSASSGRWFVYDEIRRLVSARNRLTPTPGAEINTYGYDAAGNRTSDSELNPQGIAGNLLYHSYIPNNLNQIESFTTEGGGIVGSDVILTYDLAGNLTDDGMGKTFEWDAANRLRAINHGSGQRSEFSYDGLDRRVKIVEKSGSTVTSTKHFVWVGNTIAQERDGDNKVTRQYFAEGEQREKSRYYTRDHLGSIRELTDSAGTLMARYDYDPYGQRTKVAGTEDVDFGYTGHYFHAPSGLNLTLYRAYNPALGRWICRDPIGEGGGTNLYGYVGNDPLNQVDPLGLFGFGVIAAGGGDGGLAYPLSAGGIVAGGIGLFDGGFERPYNSGGIFSTAGGFLGPNSAVASPRGYEPWSFAGSVGGGLGPFVTNARSACDIEGAFDNGTINTPWGSLNIAWGRASDNKFIWFGSFIWGKGVIASISSYPTYTKLWPANAYKQPPRNGQ